MATLNGGSGWDASENIILKMHTKLFLKLSRKKYKKLSNMLMKIIPKDTQSFPKIIKTKKTLCNIT